MIQFNLSQFKKIAGGWPTGKKRKRIKDRGIKWEEHYQERSQPLKKKLEEEVGPGSYYRWEGHDYWSDSDYFVVVGPAITKYGQKKFFAGIKKLPPAWSEHKIYAPYGEYFSNINSALSHASEKWGIPFPRGQHNYSSADLQNVDIPRHVKA